jgi:transcriptional regulator with XRE-family HTH domain
VPIGEALAQARHRAGLSVAQVSERTCIREAIIRAIEKDDYSVCGGDFYARGHIRAIAKVVGSDPGPLIGEYDRLRRAPSALATVSLEELLAASAQTPQRLGRNPLRDWASMVSACVSAWRRVSLPARGGMTVAPRARGRHRMRWVAAVGLAVVVVLGLGVYWLLPSAPHAAAGRPAAAAHAADSHAGRAARPDQARRVSQAAPMAPAHRARKARQARILAPLHAAAFGPGGGDNPQLAHLAIDSHRGTGWHTDWYTTARFGNLYRGTGLLLVMRRAVAITRVQINLGRVSGASFQLRIGPKPTFARMRPAAHATGVGGVVRLRLPRPAHGRYILVWLTKLPQNRVGTFQGGIYNVNLRGHG